MKSDLRVLAAASSLSLGFFATDGAFAQKAGGILHVGHFDSPASMSMLEESTQAVNPPMSGVFNNLVMFKQDVPQNITRRSRASLPRSIASTTASALKTSG